MNIKGKILQCLPIRQGTSANGEWQSQDYVLEYGDDFKRKMVFTIFGKDKIERANVVVGDEATVYFDIDAREYQGKWYNSIKAWKVERDAVPQQQAAPQQYQQPQQQVMFTNDDPFAPSSNDDNIPF